MKHVNIFLVLCFLMPAANGAHVLEEKILFTKMTEGGDFDIWMMDPDGNEDSLEILIEDPGYQIAERVSNAADKLGYLERAPGSSVFTFKTLDLITGETKVIRHDVGSFEWLPGDQGWIAMHPNGPNADIVELDSDGNVVATIVSGPRDQILWGVDGDLVYYWDRGDGESIKVLDRASGVTDYVLRPNGVGEGDGSLSPDGELLAYSKRGPGNTLPEAIWTISLADKVETPITDRLVRSGRPHWSPDGNLIAFIRHDVHPGNNQVRIVEAQSPFTDRLLFDDGAVVESVAWVRLLRPLDIDRYCPCDGFRNHGQRQSCVARMVVDLVQKGSISEEEGDDIVSSQAKLACGKGR